MKKNNKKQNTYVKYGVVLAVSAAIGAVFGIVFHNMQDTFLSAASVSAVCIAAVRNYILEILMGILLVEAVAGEYLMKKLKRLSREIVQVQEDAADRLDYEQEKTAGIGTACMGICAFLSTVFIAAVYSVAYIEHLQIKALLKLLVSFALYLVIYIYNGYWGVRFVKLEQEQDPSKKGDPSSVKFQTEYLESCDEAEKELIYQSAFSSYTLMSQCYGAALLAAMLLHLIWNTGVTAIVLVGILQLMHVLSYAWFCVRKKGKKLKSH